MNYEDVLTKWRAKKILKPEDLDAELDNFRIIFAYNSNKIENPDITLHNTREIFENGKVVNYSGDLRTLFEIENQKICFEYLKSKICDKESITIDLILDIHRILMNGCYDEKRFIRGERPGQFKKHEYIVGDDVGVLPEDVSNEVNYICEAIKDIPKDKVLTAAAYFHLNFESIHPFADGNGRVGRTLMNYYLMINDYPPVIIYDENKDTYYMALSVFDKTDKIDGFIEFIKEQAVKTWTVKTPKLSKKSRILCL